MRTKKQLASKEFNDNMQPLIKLLTKEKIPFLCKRHAGSEPKVKELLGYYPAGEWHIMINNKVSVIRGMVSFGDYEAYLGKYKEPERFKTAQAVVKDYLEKYKLAHCPNCDAITGIYKINYLGDQKYNCNKCKKL